MLVALTADWHLGCLTHSSIDEKTQVPTRALDFEAAISGIFEDVARRQISRLVVPGDLYHVNDPPTTYVARSIELVRDLGRKCRESNHEFEMHGFDGNHDFNGKPGKRDATAPMVEALRGEPWFKWYHRRRLVEDFAPGVRALFIPHGSESRSDRFTDDSKTNLVICHTTIEGAVSGAEETLLADKVRELGEIGGPVHAYLAGHIHKPQEFRYRDSLVVYPGSPERIDFGERKDVKSYAIIDTDAVRSGAVGAVVRVPTTTRPFVQIELSVDSSWSPQSVQWPEVSGAIVKVVVHVAERDISHFAAAEVRDLLVKRGANYVCGFAMDIDRERQVRDSMMTERLTPVEALRRYIDSNVPQRTAEEQRMAATILSEGERIMKSVNNA